MNNSLETVNQGRRGFLRGMAGILAAGVAPAAVGSSILMPVRELWTPPDRLWLFEDGMHDDTAGLQAWLDGKAVYWPNGEKVGRVVLGGSFVISSTIYLRPDQPTREMVGNTLIGSMKDDGPMIHYTRITQAQDVLWPRLSVP